MRRSQKVREALIAAIEKDLNALIASQKNASEGVTHEDNRSEGDKDMRSTEASYIARGLAQRVETLRDNLGRLKTMPLPQPSEETRVAIGHVVEVENDDGKVQAFFLCPFEGGRKVLIGDQKIVAISPQSPIGALLMNSQLDDEVVLERPEGARVLTICAIS